MNEFVGVIPLERIPHDPANDPSAWFGAQPDMARVWHTLLAVRRAARTGDLPDGPSAIWLQADGAPGFAPAGDRRAELVIDAAGRVAAAADQSAEIADFVALYAPLLSATTDRPLVVGHLGQSLDAQIATREGDSFYVTGPENLTHLHRMRALCDAIVVGAATVAKDDPRLTTRRVPGPNPVRVIIDPNARLRRNYQVYRDRAAPTLTVVARDCLPTGAGDDDDPAVIVADRDPACGERSLDLKSLLRALRARSLHSLFIEGGGVTVSRWMAAGLLDRLQIATAPMLVGAGRPGLQLPAMASMRDSLRPACNVYRMGDDVMWDFDLRAPVGDRSDPPPADLPHDCPGRPPRRLI